ncbi:MAG: anaerobic sulfatase maturase [Nibricoccus sp.]
MPDSPALQPATPFHVMAKPMGPKCNLDCTYCFYLEKEKLYPETRSFRMSDEVLERFVSNYINAQPGTEVHFAWQGGEPTLLGVEFFKKVVAFQRRYAGRRTIVNALQTNGTLLNEEWGRFLAENHFLVGISIDGPRELHDIYRVDRGGKPTFERVMAGLQFLKKYRVEFNTLTVVNRQNSLKPDAVYDFLKRIGSTFMQFIPLVERTASPASPTGLKLASPPLPGVESSAAEIVTEWSVRPEDYGRFLTRVFDKWVREDVGRVFVQLFDVTLANWYGEGPGICVFSEKCGGALAIEHNGDVYSCDHYVYPEFRLGNIVSQSLGSMATSFQQRNFGAEKSTALPRYCRECEVRFACHGECPKHRFIRTPDGEGGLNYLCAAYKIFFNHVRPSMDEMVRLLRAGRSPEEVMKFSRD